MAVKVLYVNAGSNWTAERAVMLELARRNQRGLVLGSGEAALFDQRPDDRAAIVVTSDKVRVTFRVRVEVP